MTCIAFRSLDGNHALRLSRDLLKASPTQSLFHSLRVLLPTVHYFCTTVVDTIMPSCVARSCSWLLCASAQ